MTQPKYDIFISYSRKDFDEVNSFVNMLKARIPALRYWFDITGIESGDEFEDKIISAIDNSQYVLFALSDNALRSTWTKDEVMYAKNNGKKIIPLLLKGASLKGWFLFKFGRIDCIDSTSELQVEKLLGDIARWTGKESVNTGKSGGPQAEVLKPSQPNLSAKAAEHVGAIIHIETDIDCRVLKFGKEIGLARAGEDLVIRLRKGKHKLEFVSTEESADRSQTVFAVEDNEMEDILQVELAAVRAARLEAKRKEQEQKEEERREQERREQERREQVRKERERKEQERKEQERKEQERREQERRERERKKLERKEQERKERERRLAIPDEDICSFEENDKYGFKVKSTGEVLIPPKYDNPYISIDIELEFGFSEGLARVKLNDKYGFIDKNDKEVIPFKYDYAYDFSEGLAIVELNGKYGYIDKNGKEVTPLKYRYNIEDVLEQVFKFSEGLAKVNLNGKWGYVDKTGKEVIPPKYDRIGKFSEGLAKVELNYQYGFIDKTGKEVIPLKYDDAFIFSEGLARVKLNGKWFNIDKNGNRVNEHNDKGNLMRKILNFKF